MSEIFKYAFHAYRLLTLVWCQIFLFFFYLLINRRDKSKTFTSRLMDQRARLVMMSRQGNPPEELENEKIAEFQLEKKKVRELMNKKLEKKKKKTLQHVAP